MTISIKKIALFCALAATFAACKKDSTTPGSGTCLLTAITDSANGKANNLEWKEGKLAIVTYGNYKTTYNYYSGMLVTQSDTSGVFQRRDTMILNAAGYVKSQGNITYEYDGEGHKVKETNGSYGTMSSEWSGGNLVKETETGSSSTYTTTYEYFTDKKNWIPSLFYGKESTNLVKKETGSAGYTTEYQYEFDAKGNATIVRSVRKDNTGTVTYTSKSTNTFKCD